LRGCFWGKVTVQLGGQEITFSGYEAEKRIGAVLYLFFRLKILEGSGEKTADVVN
jgi:hypothetical protein